MRTNLTFEKNSIFMSSFPTPKELETEHARLELLQEHDFDKLYQVASDPNIWEQHPNKDRWQREVFAIFFEGALQSGSAYLIYDKITGELAGSTRFYDYNEEDNSIFIGYTFYATRFWGTGINKEVKKAMLDYAFQFADLVHFHVGVVNMRSRKAMEKLGAKFVEIIPVAYHGEEVRDNVHYIIQKTDWQLSFY